MTAGEPQRLGLELGEPQHLSIVREYCGHGIGQIFHEDPQVLHYGERGQGLQLQPGGLSGRTS